MKLRTIPVLFFLLASATSLAQDCATSADCLQNGINAYYMKPSLEFMEKALKLAKKEKVNPSNIYLQRGIKYYNHYEPSVKEAEKDFLNAIEADANNFWAHMWLANVYCYKQQDLNKATEYLTSVQGKFNNDPRVFYERAHMYRWYNNLDMASTDMEMAYNLMMDDASLVDEGRRVDIVLWHAKMYCLKKKIFVLDNEVVKILEPGLKLAPNNAKLLGALALAYYDVDRMNEAGEFGDKANAAGAWNSGGQLFESFKYMEQKNAQAAYECIKRAAETDVFSHPMIHYMYAWSHWDYIATKSPDSWYAYKAGIREQLEKCYYNGKGTKYDQYASWAYSNFDKVK